MQSPRIFLNCYRLLHSITLYNSSKETPLELFNNVIQLKMDYLELILNDTTWAIKLIDVMWKFRESWVDKVKSVQFTAIKKVVLVDQLVNSSHNRLLSNGKSWNSNTIATDRDMDTNAIDLVTLWDLLEGVMHKSESTSTSLAKQIPTTPAYVYTWSKEHRKMSSPANGIFFKSVSLC